jgi:hypothetical protein
MSIFHPALTPISNPEPAISCGGLLRLWETPENFARNFVEESGSDLAEVKEASERVVKKWTVSINWKILLYIYIYIVIYYYIFIIYIAMRS